MCTVNGVDDDTTHRQVNQVKVKYTIVTRGEVERRAVIPYQIRDNLCKCDLGLGSSGASLSKSDHQLWDVAGKTTQQARATRTMLECPGIGVTIIKNDKTKADN